MSGIYIPGVEMPKNCDDCDLMTVAGEYGEPTCPFGRIIRCASERHPDCPLIPVPEHGSLIEKNAVFELIWSFPNVDRQLPVEFMKALYELPTIIPADKEEEP